MAKRPPDPLRRFLLALLFWLPLMFLVWYSLAPAINWIPALLLDGLMGVLHPGVIAAVERVGNQLDVVTRLPLPPAYAAQLAPGQQADLVFNVNPMVYGYGLPLYTALVIATPGDEYAHWRFWLVGLPLILVSQLWGVYFDTLKTLLFQMGPEAAQSIPLASWQLEGVALAYQMGALILPPVLPVVMWMMQSRAFIGQLVRDRGD